MHSVGGISSPQKYLIGQNTTYKQQYRIAQNTKKDIPLAECMIRSKLDSVKIYKTEYKTA